MPIYEKPLRPIKTESTAHARKKVEARRRQDIRAQQRLAWAQFARSHPGTLGECREAMLEAIRQGELPSPFIRHRMTLEQSAPGIAAIRKWRAMPASEVTVEGLRHKNRGGRPRTTWAQEVEAEFNLQIDAGTFTRPTPLWKHLKAYAEQRGLEVPTQHQVWWRMGDLPLVRRTVGRHGKRAGIADAMVHGAVPAQFAHEVWVLDELDVPVWMKTYSFEAGQMVAVKPSLVVIVDGASGAIISYFLANPLSRGALKGADTDDVMAAIVSGLFPELAPSACRRYAGWMPKIIRYDRAPIHSESRRLLRNVGISVPDLPGYAPWARGQVEASVNVIKKALPTFRGHEAAYRIAEYASKQDLTTREAATRSGDRLTEKTPLLIEDLYSAEQLRQKIDDVVTELNERLNHEESGMPRAARYGLALDRDQLHDGRNALSLLRPHRVIVQKAGVVVNRIPFEGRTADYEFFVGRRVDLRLDPALRGVFAQGTDGKLVFLRPKREAALTTDPAEVAHRINQTVDHYDRQSRAAKEILRQREVGPESAELADAVAEEELDALTTLAGIHRAMKDVGGSPFAYARNPGSPKKKPKKVKSAESAGGSRERQAPPQPRTRKAPPALPPNVVPITRAPSLSKPPAPEGTSAPARRGIIRSFR